jgi:thiol-disulfide isomerase/thioredoxin
MATRSSPTRTRSSSSSTSPAATAPSRRSTSSSPIAKRVSLALLRRTTELGTAALVSFASFASLAALVAIACTHSPAPDEIVVGKSERPEAAGPPVQFSLDSLDSRPVSTGTVVGKPTVVAFVTTWDLSSQAQVDYLVPMSKKDGDQVNYVMVALQEAKDRELVEVFARGLGVTFPAALGDQEMIEGAGPFGSLRAVPTTVVLDRAARMVWRHVGLARPEEIREGLSGL